MAYRKETASQTAGPYVHIGLAPRAAGFESYDTDLGGEIAGPDAAGERIRVEGTVFDGSGSPVRDALIEVWQADADGSYAGASPGFTGWGRVAPDFETGRWAFDTIKPGRVTGRDGLAMAPHIALWIVARGINVGLHTRLYFDDEAEANATDPVLTLVEMVTRRRTLIAVREGDTYRFDIHLQGPDETVFFDI